MGLCSTVAGVNAIACSVVSSVHRVDGCVVSRAWRRGKGLSLGDIVIHLGDGMVTSLEFCARDRACIPGPCGRVGVRTDDCWDM